MKITVSRKAHERILSACSGVGMGAALTGAALTGSFLSTGSLEPAFVFGVLALASFALMIWADLKAHALQRQVVKPETYVYGTVRERTKPELRTKPAPENELV